ncbi:hypothetical protein P5G51_002520 [Virgibacillus sp. 179-BFC.A HS]|uniref:Uncharacterized protein n=1 Tax=Tigheibacillus jepli TaxID=3035914 RepID=A0ABU5CDM0_9BACI|nr:hypothetical protein [Virgibacillus sp. 179-BFC.A HS]MDY0404437.1 hypothetical protein [Virgibacillus sp. 179-BFC.A HS]
MKNIGDIDIQQLFPSFIYRRGLEYYNQRRVRNLLYDVNNELWTATVRGSRNYFVEIEASSIFTGHLKAECDCPALICMIRASILQQR